MAASPIPAQTMEMTALPTPSQPQGSDKLSPVTEHHKILGLGQFAAPSSWDIHQKDDQWQAFMPQTSSAGTQELCLVPGIEVQ